MSINEIRNEYNKTVFPLGYVLELHADLYSVYHGTNNEGKGLWSIYVLERTSTRAYQHNIGIYTGMTLEQYMEAK